MPRAHRMACLHCCCAFSDSATAAPLVCHASARLAVYEVELPVTYLARADFGVFIALLLSPVQFALYRAAREGALAERMPRLLNLVCAAAICLLDGCGNAQVRRAEAANTHETRRQLGAVFA